MSEGVALFYEYTSNNSIVSSYLKLKFGKFIQLVRVSRKMNESS